MYYMRQDNMNLGLKLVGMIRQKGGVDYIPAIRNEQDFRNVDREEWLRLFEAILEKSIYEILLLDLGDSINGLYQILENCGRFIHRILTRESQRQSWINMKRVCGFPVMEKFFPGQ